MSTFGQAGPYLGLALGAHNPVGVDYYNVLGNGLAGELILGWRVTPVVAVELAANSGQSQISGGGTAQISELEIDARFHPFLNPRHYGDVVIPSLTLGLVPVARASLPGFLLPNPLEGYGSVLGVGLTVQPRGTPVYFTGEVRYDLLRFGKRGGNGVSNGFDGDDEQVLFGVGFRLPVSVIER